jgi:hypothetical protein
VALKQTPNFFLPVASSVEMCITGTFLTQKKKKKFISPAAGNVEMCTSGSFSEEKKIKN